MEKIKNHVEEISKIGISDSYRNYHEFILEKGKTFTESKSHGRLPFVKQKECFKNSLLGALLYDDLEYYEGYYLTDIPLPFEHGFNVDSAGNLVDLTAEKFDIPVHEWFGVLVPKDVLEDYLETDQFLTPLQYYFQQIKTAAVCQD